MPKHRLISGKDFHDLELVVWEDSRQTNSSWIEHDDIGQPRPAICMTVGWVVKETAACILIAQSVGDFKDSNFQSAGRMTIPKSCIRSRKVWKNRREE